jgi:hypothetical protein
VSLPNSHYYSKLKGDEIYASTCLLNLSQCLDTLGNGNLFDLAFSNLSDLGIIQVDPGLIKPDNYHPPLLINLNLPSIACTYNYRYFYRKFSSGNYVWLYNILSTFECSSVYGASFVDSAVACLNAAVQDAIEQSMPSSIINSNLKYPHWYSSSLRYYIKKNNYYYRRVKKKKSDCLYEQFLFYSKLVKAAIKSDRIRWFQYVDNTLNSQPKQFWRYVASFGNSNLISIQLEVGGKLIIQSDDVADEFAKHFQSVYNSHCPIVLPALLPSSDVLPLASVSNSDVINAIKRLRPSKSAGLDNIPGFIIKDCIHIFVLILKHICNLSLYEHCFPTLWKQAAIIPVFRKGKRTSVSNYRAISLVSNF